MWEKSVANDENECADDADDCEPAPNAGSGDKSPERCSNTGSRDRLSTGALPQNDDKKAEDDCAGDGDDNQHPVGIMKPSNTYPIIKDLNKLRSMSLPSMVPNDADPDEDEDEDEQGENDKQRSQNERKFDDDDDQNRGSGGHSSNNENGHHYIPHGQIFGRDNYGRFVNRGSYQRPVNNSSSATNETENAIKESVSSVAISLSPPPPLPAQHNQSAQIPVCSSPRVATPSENVISQQSIDYFTRYSPNLRCQVAEVRCKKKYEK